MQDQSAEEKSLQKYSKVTPQKKYHLLSLIYKEGLSVRDAAQALKINHLTAKTIVFFYKNHYKTYQFDLRVLGSMRHRQSASYQFYNQDQMLNVSNKMNKKIEIICSVGEIIHKERKKKCLLSIAGIESLAATNSDKKRCERPATQIYQTDHIGVGAMTWKCTKNDIVRYRLDQKQKKEKAATPCVEQISAIDHF